MDGEREDSKAQGGFRRFEHGPPIVEDEIERLGAFGAGARRPRDWKKGVAVFLVVGLVLPMVLGTLFVLIRAL